MSRGALVVVPAWNEEASIANVVHDLKSHGFDVLVVDDGSTDKTFYEAHKCGATVLRLPFNLGVGAALRCGFKFAVVNGYQVVIQCDADGQHPIEHISDLLQTLEANVACNQRPANGRVQLLARSKTECESSYMRWAAIDALSMG